MAEPTPVKKPAVLKAYKPSLRERAQIGMEGLYTRTTGREPGYGPRRLMGKASELLDFIPGVGDVIGIDETKRALDRRRYLEAGLTGAGTMLGVVPIVGDVAGKVLKGAAKPAQQAAEKLAAKYGTAAAEPLTAYHGSPHKFDRFDMSKLRTGEGQNVYGEGLYLAEHPDVAKAYREALAGPASGGSVTFRNRPIVTKGAPGGSWGMELLDADLKPRDVAADLLRNYGKVEDTIAQYRNYATEQRSRWASGLEGDVPGVGSNVSASGREALRRLTLESADTHDRMANFLEKYGQDFKVRAPGYTYEVGIKAEPEQFMDWDKPLSEQSKLVQSGLGDFAEQRAARANAARAELLARGVQGGRPLTPQRIAELSVRVLPEEVTGQRLYNMTAIDLGALKAGDKGAETRRKLLDLGIAGNRYRDQGSRSGIGLGTHNYAVFDDELLNIKDRYAEGGPVVPGNIDLHNRPVVRNSDDSISTVLSITVGFGDKTYVLPRVVGGKVVSNQEAIDHFRQTGEHLGAYDKQKDAEDYSQRLHEEQAKEYKDKARGGLVKKYAEGGRASTALDAAFAKRKARANALAEATVRNIPDLAKQGPGAVADALKDAYGLGERYLRSRTPGGVVADVAGGARALRDATTRYATDRAQNPMKVLADAYGVGKDIVTAVPQAVEDVAKLSERAQALKASDPEAARRLQASIAMAALGVVPGVRKGKQAVKAAEQAVKAAERAPQAIQLGRREMHPGTKGFIEDYRNATSENPLDASSAVHGDYAVTELSPSSRGIHLSDIRSLQPGAGGGTRALKELKALADKHNVPITGTAVAYHRDPKYIGSSTELRDWYKKHGFEDLGGDAREGYDIQYYPAAQQAAEKVAAKYLDPESTRIADWQWRPQEDVKAELGLTEVPPHVVDYGRFMDEQAMRAAKGQMTPRDLLKAYGITRSSMQRKARSLKTAQKYGLELEQLGLEKVRPEGAFSELLGTPEGQAYLDAAQRGQVDDRAIADMMAKFRPYGFQNALGRDLEWGARNLPQRSSEVADMVAAAREGASAPEDWTRFVKDKVTGVDAAKAGFVGAMLGRGDLPTFDARQIILQTGQPTKKATKYLSRKKGEGSVEAVRRLTARMEDLNLALPPELEPYRQHLTHHTVWDKASNEMTTHEDVRNALKNYAGGGLVKKYGV